MDTSVLNLKKISSNGFPVSILLFCVKNKNCFGFEVGGENVSRKDVQVTRQNAK